MAEVPNCMHCGTKTHVRVYETSGPNYWECTDCETVWKVE